LEYYLTQILYLIKSSIQAFPRVTEFAQQYFTIDWVYLGKRRYD